MRNDLRTAEREGKRRSAHGGLVAGERRDGEGVEVRKVAVDSSESAENGTYREVPEGSEQSFERVLESGREERREASGKSSCESSDGPSESFDRGKVGKKTSSQSSSETSDSSSRTSNESRDSAERRKTARDRASESNERRDGDGKTVGKVAVGSGNGSWKIVG